MNNEKLDNLVKEMIKEHEGGEKFFDNLDEAVREETYTYDLMKLAGRLLYTCNIIVSGKFGRYFMNFVETSKLKVNIVNGGLRSGARIEDDLCYIEELDNKEFIFFDDSFYSGKTRNVIKEYLEERGAVLLDTYVIYDGSKEKDPYVHSLYRYYDDMVDKYNKITKR